ncbi:glycoside hydrolase family 10 protein [Amniculicola lignicola CBS 123094]|uniref:Beta-xylanase n=1 Tax=Amniculicola lignicola CBS 123094 TaxID=1392246 RepID=A0A6A5WLQ8_9PLEO|nr:glycoside hydrolase family 10 protein [Amniculicola lignicola CBS 123094]
MKVSLALALVPLLAAAAPSPSDKHHSKPKPKPKIEGLGALAVKAGLQYFGTAIDNVVLDNKNYTSIAFNVSEFNQVTPSNGMKWMYFEPQRNVFNATLADQIVKPARKAGQLRRCHTFIWHNQLPGWLTSRNWTAPELTAVLENHIKAEARYFKDDCIAWDVVNEAFNDDGTWRDTIWLRTLGKSYIELAFTFARKYVGKKTMLYYNDYNVERVNNKSLAVVELVKDFKKRDIPIDGVGLQAHFTVGRSPSYNETSASIAQFNKLGMEVAITELDVRLALPDTAEKSEAQAKVYADTVKACVDAKDCVGVTVWDFWDPVSWVPETFPGNGNACLWTEGFVKKPAYYAIQKVFQDAAA